MVSTQIARKARLAAALTLLIALLAGAVALTRGANLEPADFTFNNGTEVQSLDPALVTGVPEGRVVRCLYEGLVIKDPRTLAPMPGMAESWDLSEDGKTYTFHIRDGAQWTNGDTVTAHDFAWSMKRMLNPRTGSQYAYQLWYVVGAKAFTTEVFPEFDPEFPGEEVPHPKVGQPRNSPDSVAIRALDDKTLEIELVSPTPFFMELMGFYPVFPVNRRAMEEAQEKWPRTWEIEWMKPKNIVTNGPWTLHSRRVNDRIRLVKNDNYWDADNVAFRTIDVLAMEQASTAQNLYLTGGADYVDKVDDAVVKELLPREDFNPKPYLGTYFYRVNTSKPPFDDKRVRKALSLVLPRKLICDEVTKMGQVPAYSFVPPMALDYTSPETDRGATEGTQKERMAKNAITARALLAEAGYGPEGKEFPSFAIHYNTSDAHKAIAETITAAWQQHLGINVRMRNEEWKVYLDTQNTLDYDLSRSAWIGDYMDPNTFVDLFLKGGENNKTGWGHEEYDRLVHGAVTEVDVDKRFRMLERAEAILMDELPIIPIYYYVDQNIVAPRLGGFYPNPEDEHFPKFWYWMDDEELAAKRAAQPADWKIVDPHGPSEGLYSPAQARLRAQK
ncbi:MAG: peptide ABC transporter substrate-binding protein [Planctomycetes bacterium]|nr:peptide ABC transporter substrate-binding protein [Planctomycetota bacterium]